MLFLMWNVLFLNDFKSKSKWVNKFFFVSLEYEISQKSASGTLTVPSRQTDDESPRSYVLCSGACNVELYKIM